VQRDPIPLPPAPPPGPPAPPPGPPAPPPGGEPAPPPELRAAQPAPLPAAPPHAPERRDLAAVSPEARREHPTSPELRALRAELASDMRAAGGGPELPAGPAVATPAPSSARPAPARRAGEPFKPPQLAPFRWPGIPDYAGQARRPAPDAEHDHDLTVQDEKATSDLRALIRAATTDPPPAVVPRDEAAEKAAHLHNRAAKPAPAQEAKPRTTTLLGFGDIPAKQPTPPPSAERSGAAQAA
jgi:hypothetical protein